MDRLIVSLAFTVCVSAAAAAQGSLVSPQQATTLQRSCSGDYAAHCIGNNPAPPIAAACLSQFYVNLGPTCRAALDAYNRENGNRSDNAAPAPPPGGDG